MALQKINISFLKINVIINIRKKDTKTEDGEIDNMGHIYSNMDHSNIFKFGMKDGHLYLTNFDNRKLGQKNVY